MSSIKDNIFDESYWINRHANEDTAWHKPDVNPRLIEYKDLLFFKSSPLKVFVPLCGKTKDLKWFYDQGCCVVGVEIATQALKEFFEENNLKYSIKGSGDNSVYVSEDERIKLYSCNLYKFPEISGEKDFDIVWDRGSLVAINTSERKQYVELMSSLVASEFRYLLESYDYDPTEYGGPPKTLSDAELEELFMGRFKMQTLLKVEMDMSKFGITAGKLRSTLLTPL